MQSIIDTLVYQVIFILLFFRNGFKVKTALFYPRRPSNKATIVRILRHLNYNIAWKPNVKYDIAVNWEDATFRSGDDILVKLMKETNVLNSDCTDISKQYIGEVFEQIFGYPILIDPLTYQTKCLKKNNLNAHKEFTSIVDCPINQTEDGFVYTILVDSKIDDEYYVDYRMPIIGNEIPLVFYKKKFVENRFLSPYFNVTIEDPADYFSEEEITNIKRFTKAIGLDMGELDILRDSDDGKIYIVDANNTPWGPLRGLKGPLVDKAMTTLVDSFKREFLNEN